VVLGNEAALTQWFSNLLSNAVRFAKAGSQPQIRVWAELRGQQMGAEKEKAGSRNQWGTPQNGSGSGAGWGEDNGVGIPSRFQARIFGMFQRASAEREGTGIGLAIVRKVVRRMGGEVGVESAEGQGSRFWVELRELNSDGLGGSGQGLVEDINHFDPIQRLGEEGRRS
ncbi:MAG TPA: HAMP domain-containing sensor histidine kinase, partial [Candidatus Sulfotelmatobacter sp.]|nr:HAMP domain-containing sensor histidine kinase [Candidatus Sulfotelmatobacter sp.]